MNHPWVHKEFKDSLGYMSLCLKMNKQNQQNKKWAWEGGSVAKNSGSQHSYGGSYYLPL